MTVSLNELDRAWALLGQQRFVESERQAEAVLARFPDNVSALACRAMAHWKAGGDIAASLADMHRAVSLAPDVASIRHNLATLLASHGDVDGAAAEFRAAMRIKPDDTMAFYGLTQNHKFRESEPLIDEMVALDVDARLEPARREFLDYGLAKTFDDLNQPDKAMHYAVEANRLGARPWDVKGEAATLDELGAFAERDAFRTATNSGHPSRAPLFIVGMPRSGTTLVEAILARHPDTLALGESSQILEVEHAAYAQLATAQHAVHRQQLALGLNRGWLSAQAEALLKRAAARAGRAFAVMTDKLPDNAVRLGLIARLFPHAKVVHVRRHPLDTGISNFFQRFSVGQGYSTRLDWTGARIRQVADTMAIWKRALDLPILDLSYEQLVAQPEEQSRRLVAFAGLDWTDACLEPQNLKRSVLTASQWQVRQPIYRGSVGRWRRYEPWLGPMIEAMGGFGWIDAEVAALSGEGR
jgi:tetratricopeptide (TPR) repeat protein